MKQRIITGVIAGSLFAVLVYIGKWPYEALLIALSLIGYFEFVRMHHSRTFDVASIMGYLIILSVTVPWQNWGLTTELSFEALMWFSMFAFLCVTVLSKNVVPIQKASVLWLGALYIGVGFKYMIITRNSMEDGLAWTIILFAAIWASDIGAYFTGRAIGKHKLWPSISPNKTIEGAIGGVAASIAVMLIAMLICPDLLSVSMSLGIGLSAAVFGQMGDLIQSAYKRVCGVKDSGTLLPGHGGVLDRCDSWLIVFPFVHLIGLLTL
ncbi:phosphatidate cytidylyltransferase [Paenibacillus marinisediminis]